MTEYVLLSVVVALIVLVGILVILGIVECIAMYYISSYLDNELEHLVKIVVKYIKKEPLLIILQLEKEFSRLYQEAKYKVDQITPYTSPEESTKLKQDLAYYNDVIIGMGWSI